MVVDIQYGGKITDNMDRELFQAYGEDYIKENIFNNDYYFYESVTEESGGGKTRFKYKIPSMDKEISFTKFQDYVNEIPPIDTPEIFGLHANADLTFRLKESLEMMNTLAETRPKEGGGGGG